MTDHAEIIHLSRRQQQVCDAICLGLANKAIAAKLGISHRTIEDYRAQIMRKYGVHNAVELVRAVFGIAP